MGIALILAACSAAPVPAPPAQPTATPQRAPITQTSPLLEVMPLAAGASWSYSLGRSDLCLSKSTNFVVDGVITDTVTNAWQQDEVIVYEVQTNAFVFDVQLKQTNYYVIMNDRLYYILNSPDRVIETKGKGCESMQVLAWPLSLGQKIGPWTVAAEELPVVNAELPEMCYRLEKRSNSSAHDAWFCPGMGFVQYRDQGFVAPISDETRQLLAITKP